jgi:hypothetical protein
MEKQKMRINNYEGTNKDQLQLQSDWEKNIGTGLDYTSIASAVSDLGYKFVSYPKLSLEAGTYNEKILDGSEKLLCTTLELVGDTRSIVGSSYVDGYSIQTSADSGGGEGTCAIGLAGDTITVTGATTNPNFETAGLVAGDKVQTLNNDDSISTYEIESISSNALTMTTTPSAIGNDGTTLTILPDRVITNASEIIKLQYIDYTVNPLQTIKLKGFTFKGDTVMISITQGISTLLLENCAFDGQNKNISSIILYNTNVYAKSYSVSCLNANNYSMVCTGGDARIVGMNLIGSSGFHCQGSTDAHLNYARIVGGSINIYQTPYVSASYSVVLAGGIQSHNGSHVYARYATIKNCTTANVASVLSYINAKNQTLSGNTANYSPATSLVAGNYGSYVEQ